MDGNGYPDIVVGAYQNATAMYYRQVEYMPFFKKTKLKIEMVILILHKGRNWLFIGDSH